MQQILKNTIDFSSDKVVLFKFESKSKLAAYSMGIYCTLIELSDTFSFLINNQNYTGSLAVYRSFIENFVDLRNLKLNALYVNQLDYGSCIQEQRNLKAAQNGNRYMKSIAQYAEEKLPLLKNKIESLKANVEFKICHSIKEKFALAGLAEEYEGIYPTLSAESHCSLEAIMGRHFEFDATNKNVNLIIHNKDQLEAYSFYIINMSNYLITAGILVANILEGQQLHEFVAEKERIMTDLENYI